MAFTKPVKTSHGFDVQEPYIVVQAISKLTKTSMEFSVAFKKEQTSLAFEVSQYKCSYDIQGDNPIRQAYKHLKTLPEFAGAIDC
jgi:hypothetical protein